MNSIGNRRQLMFIGMPIRTHAKCIHATIRNIGITSWRACAILSILSSCCTQQLYTHNDESTFTSHTHTQAHTISPWTTMIARHLAIGNKIVHRQAGGLACGLPTSARHAIFTNAACRPRGKFQVKVLFCCILFLFVIRFSLYNSSYCMCSIRSFRSFRSFRSIVCLCICSLAAKRIFLQLNEWHGLFQLLHSLHYSYIVFICTHLEAKVSATNSNNNGGRFHSVCPPTAVTSYAAIEIGVMLALCYY